MTALRYLLALPGRHGDKGGQIALVDRPELALDGPPALWCSDPAQLLWAQDRRSVVIGTLFDRLGAGPVTDIAAEARRLSAPPDSLVEDYWGAYLAVFAREGDFMVLRDPTGLLPCYVREREDSVFLASDVGTLEAAGLAPGAVDPDRLFEFLHIPGIRRSATCLEGLEELAPGVLAGFGREGRSGRRVWTPWAFTGADCRISSKEAVGALRDTICSTITALGGGYQNILVAMSGGLDSSIVCAALAAAGQRFTAMTMYTDDPGGDERSYARLVAEQCGASLHDHCYAAARIDLSKSVSRHLPRPVGRTFMQEIEYAYRSEVAASGFDAIFTGNGGDNVFCYLHSAGPIVDRLRTAGERRGIARTFVDMCRITECDLATMARATLSLLVRPHPRAAAHDGRLLNRDREGGRSSPVLTPFLDEATRLPGKRSHIEMLMRIQNHVEGYDRQDLPPAIPVLLAQPIVETCLSIPSWDWCRGGINRAIAREAFRPLLPQAIVARRSKSGPESLTAAVFELGRQSLRDLLLGGALREGRIIDAAAVEAALDDPAVTRGQLLYRLLELAEAEAWARSWAARSQHGT